MNGTGLSVLKALGEFVLESPLLSLVVARRAKGLVKSAFEDGLGYERRPRFLSRGLAYERRPIPELENVACNAKVELHKADRAGDHLDLRIEMPDGTIQDFAVPRRTDLPAETGDLARVVPTPNHNRAYFLKDGKWRFPAGSYGAGEVETVWRGIVDVHSSGRSRMEFTMTDGPWAGRYAIRKLNRGWVLLRMKGREPFWKERMPFSSTEAAREKAYADPNVVAERKVDGACYMVRPGPKGNAVWSRRLSVEGKPIDRADRIPQLRDWVLPKKFHGRTIHVEVVADGGSAAETAGLLNARPALSRANQLRLHPLKVYVWDVEGPGPYEARRREALELARLSPRIDGRILGSVRDRFLLFRRLFRHPLASVPECNAETGETPRAFAARMKAAGEEGVVLKDRTAPYYGDVWTKDKKVERLDLVVVGFAEGEGRLAGTLGSLVCEDPKTGAVSLVGSGFSDDLRSKIWEGREGLRGVAVMVDAHETTVRGKARGPRFAGFHPDSGVEIRDEQSLYDYAAAASEPGEGKAAKYRMISSRGWRRR